MKIHNKSSLQAVGYIFLFCILWGCSDRNYANYIPEMGIFIEPDYDSHRINFYKNKTDKPDFIEFRGYGEPEIRYYPPAHMIFIPPDTICVMQTDDEVMKIHEENFKILLCDSDSTGYFYNMSLDDHKSPGAHKYHAPLKYPKGITHPFPGNRGFKIEVNNYFYYLWITDSTGQRIFNLRFKDPGEIHIPR